MTGSLQTKKKAGKDMFYVVISYKSSQTGKWKQKWVATGLAVQGNKKEAKRLVSEILEKYSYLESHQQEAVIGFSEFLEKWLAQKKNSDIQLDTYEGYQDHLSHAIRYFKERPVKLMDVKPNDIREFYEYQMMYGKLNKRTGERTGLATRTIRSQKILINAALQQAVEDEIITRNPAAGIKISNKKNSDFRKQEIFLMQDKANDLLEFMKGNCPFLRPLVCITLYYGLRRSEVLGLKWDSIDLDNNKMIIKHTIVKHRTLEAKDRTKSSSSYRSYPILPDVRNILETLREEQAENRKIFGNTYKESDYVFTWPDGKLLSPDYVTKRFKKVAHEFGIPKLRFHDLRHSCASILYGLGYTAKEIQDWLGHADIVTTMNIYTHIEKHQGVQDTSRINNLLKY